ncbi:MAG: AMP-binding protein [Paracoccaceae bacterium]
MLGDFNDLDAIRREFSWRVPKAFNIAQACCSSWAASHPEKIALIHVAANGDVQEWSYGDLELASNRLANSLRARGIGRGDRVAILLPQCPEVLITHFAVYKLAAIAVPLFTLFGPDALAYRLADSSAKAIVTDGDSLEKLVSIQAKLPELKEIYSTSNTASPIRDLGQEMAAASKIFTPEPTQCEDPAMIIYTSGTTGPPKGALHAHQFLLGHLPAIELHHGGFPKANDCGWTPADWAWIGGLMDMAMPCLFYGVPLVSQRLRKFDPEAAYGLIGRFKIRNLFMPPTALKLMQNTPVPRNVNIRSISSGGESLGAEILAWSRDRLGAQINEIYGQTECNLVICGAAALGGQRAGFMGQAVPGHSVAILDEFGQPAAPGTLGEIAVRRPDPVMFLGYWNRPGDTAAKFKGDWLCTGDLGIMDADGYFTFQGREDDVINSAGYRIGPTEIENALKGHRDVVMAAAIGFPDPVRGQIVKAFVVLRSGVQWDGLEEQLIALVAKQVSPHMAPKMIEQIVEMPLTATGKIMRRSLRNRAIN